MFDLIKFVIKLVVCIDNHRLLSDCYETNMLLSTDFYNCSYDEKHAELPTIRMLEMKRFIHATGPLETTIFFGVSIIVFVSTFWLN